MYLDVLAALTRFSLHINRLLVLKAEETDYGPAIIRQCRGPYLRYACNNSFHYHTTCFARDIWSHLAVIS